MANSVVGKGTIVASPKNRDTEDENRWRAESDLRTLAEAEKIRSDKARHGEAKKMAKVKMDEMKKVCD